MFVVSAFEIHGGAGGLFDLGPPSCALKVRFGQRSVCLTLHAVVINKNQGWIDGRTPY